MKTVLITLAVLMWLLSLVLCWINCRNRERLAERADDLDKKVAALVATLEIIGRFGGTEMREDHEGVRK